MADPGKTMEAGPAKAAYEIVEREYYGNRTLTENAAGAFTTTGDHCLNFFATVVRSTSISTLLRDFVDAWNEDPNKADKLILNLRDIRGGKGEKKLPLTLMYALSCWKPLTYLANLQNFMKLGCYKDFLVISELAVRCAHIPNFKRLPQLGEGLELALMAAQLNQDEKDMDEVMEGEKKAGISLCAKWAPTEMTHYDQLPLRFSRKISKSMGIKKSEYRKKLSKLRQHLAVLERLMCVGNFDEIIFKSLPAKAHRLHRGAFKRDTNAKKEMSGARADLAKRYSEYLTDLTAGKETIKATGTQPHELIKPYVDGQYCSGRYRDSDSDEEAEKEAEKDKVDATIEGQWKALVADLAKAGSFKNCQAVCDVSGSMNGEPMQVAVALGLVVAELTEEPFHNQLITFSATPTLHEIKGSTLRDRVLDVMNMEWGMNTDLLAVFDLLLNKVAENPSAKMVESLFIFTDMQFDQASRVYGWSTTYQSVCEKYAAKNVKVPQIVFWNLRATHKSFPVEKTQEGTALVSGFSAQLMKAFMDAKLEDFNPLSIMNSTLDKYTIVEVPKAEKFPIEAGESWTQSFEDAEKVVQEFLVPKKKKASAPLKGRRGLRR